MRILFVLFLVGCTDAERANFSSIGSPAHVRCYSGGQLFYEGDSTGKVASLDKSDGWEFKDAKTGKLVRVSGPCVVEN